MIKKVRKEKGRKTKTFPLYLTQILDISRFSFLTPSLLAFRGINQKNRE
jgi:hypothetical protein